MNRTALLHALLAAALGLAACAHAKPRARAIPPAQPRGTPDAPFRAQQPQPTGEIHFTAPHVEALALENGLKVYLVERHELPLVTVELVVRSGRDADPLDKPGLAAFAADMLDEGTKAMTAPQVAAAFEDLAIGFHAGAWSSGSYAAMNALTTTLDRALDVFSQVVLHPAFRPADVERVRGQRLAQIIAAHDDPATVAHDVMMRALYGDRHPWGAPPQGTPEGIKATTRADLVKFHQAHYLPGNAALVVVGDVTRDALVRALEARFGSWRNRKAPAAKLPPVARPAARSLFLVDKPDAQQSQIWFGELALAASDPDYVPLDVANNVLGGLFSSRLNLNLREGKGWSYGVYSFITQARAAAPWMSAGGFVADKTAPSVAELLKEIERMHGGEVTDAELAKAKDALVRSLPGLFETGSATASSVGQLIALGLPVDYYATYPERVRAVSHEDVRRVAQRYLDPARLDIVVVGPRAKEGTKLEALGVARVQPRDEYGRAVK